MAKIYLDANTFIDLIENRREIKSDISEETIFISPLTVHMLCYIYKKKMPEKYVTEFLEDFIVQPFILEITMKSLEGPTDDFEDNVQLHSAVDAGASIFYTEDKKLLKMRYFGAMEIKSLL